MATSVSYISNKNGGIDMLACRHKSVLPAEHQVWAGLTPESVRHERDILRLARGHGVKVLELMQLEDGSFATLLDDSDALRALHDRYSYMLRLSPHVGTELLDTETSAILPIELRERSPHSYSGLDAENWALCVLKPDAKQLNIEQEILERISANGMCVKDMIAAKALCLTELDQLWPASYVDLTIPKTHSPWWEATVKYMTQSPVDIALVHGLDATNKLKEIKAELRKEIYGEGYQTDDSLEDCDKVKSVIHTSDCHRELITNVAAFWPSRKLEQIIEEL